MNSMSNWTTTEFNFVKSALSILTSNHEDIRKDIAGMWSVINLLGKSISGQIENSVYDVNLKLDNSINITLNATKALNTRLDDVTVKGDIQTTMDMLNISMAELSENINSAVNGSVDPAINLLTKSINVITNVNP